MFIIHILIKPDLGTFSYYMYIEMQKLQIHLMFKTLMMSWYFVNVLLLFTQYSFEMFLSV